MEFTFSLNSIYLFVLVLLRTATIVTVMPVFGRRNIPVQIKVLFGASLSLLLASTLNDTSAPPLTAGMTLFFLAIREVFIGFALGGVARLLFDAVEYAGELIGMQMGFAIAGILDPTSGRQMSVIGKFQGMLAMLMFLLVNGHYFMLHALSESFQMLPVGSMSVNIMASMAVVELAGKVFVIALQIAAPATILLLLVNVAMGVMARLVPQMNVFIVGFPLMIMVGIVALIISLPSMLGITNNLFDSVYRDFSTVLRAL